MTPRWLFALRRRQQNRRRYLIVAVGTAWILSLVIGIALVIERLFVGGR